MIKARMRERLKENLSQLTAHHRPTESVTGTEQHEELTATGA
jgi:hypothetical protein